MQAFGWTLVPSRHTASYFLKKKKGGQSHPNKFKQKNKQTKKGEILEIMKIKTGGGGVVYH